MVHEAAATGFERKADAYSRGRPGYHPELVARVAARVVDGVMLDGMIADEMVVDGLAVDVGAGTGMFTAQLWKLASRPLRLNQWRQCAQPYPKRFLRLRCSTAPRSPGLSMREACMICKVCIRS